MIKVQSLEEALAAAIAFAQDKVEGTVTSIQCDAQASGEYPYRIAVLEEQLPVPGVAYKQDDALSRPANKSSVAGVRGPGESQNG